MIYFWNNFRGHIGRRSTEGVDRPVFLAFEAEPEIDKFELPVPINQYVFGLDISMDDIKVVQVEQGLGNDENELFCLFFAEPVLRFGEEIIIKRVGAAILKDKIELGLRLDDV